MDDERNRFENQMALTQNFFAEILMDFPLETSNRIRETFFQVHVHDYFQF